MADELLGELLGFLSPAWSVELAPGNAGELFRVFTLLALLQMVRHNAGEGGREWKQSEIDQVFYFPLSEKSREN